MPVLRSGIGATAALAPNLISGLVGWWRADDITGLADGAAVTSWPDSSGNGHALSVGSGSGNPLWLASPTGFNGHAAVDFLTHRAVGMTVAFASALNPSDTTLMWVGQIANNATSQSVAQSGAFAFAKGWTWQYDSGNQNMDLITESVALGVADEMLSGGGTVDTNTMAQLWTVPSTGGLHGYRNGSNAGETTISGPASWDPNTAEEFWLGARTTGFGNTTIWYCAEFAIYNGVLSSTDRARLDAYIQNRYAVTMSDVSSGGPPPGIVAPTPAVQRASVW